MIPKLVDGWLPPGQHRATWREMAERFGTTAHRKELLAGLERAAVELRDRGCRLLYLDGSFVSDDPAPSDYDGCWSTEGVDFDALDPVLLTFGADQAVQKAKYRGELFPAESVEAGSGLTFIHFFSTNKVTGAPKGMLVIDLRTMP